MIVYYRITDISSTNPSPVYFDNKIKLNQLCLKSFTLAFEEVKPKVVFICDHCPDEYKYIIGDIYPYEKEIIFTKLGINDTCLLQYDLAKKETDDVLFQECDYLYIPRSGKYFVEAVKEFGLVSPYDHLNFYKDRTLHSSYCDIQLFNNHHYRSTERNTMTFGMAREVFNNSYLILKKHGYIDGQVWYDLKSQGHVLYVPIPSFATHAVADFMAPSVKWEELWKTLM